MKRFLKFLWIIPIAFVLIQFIHPEKNIATSPSENRIEKVRPVPKELQTIFATSCYDCHGNNTVYPWYNNIQPVAWWLSSHINDGKRHLNFDEFATYSPRRKYSKLKEIEELVNNGEMPSPSYTLAHRDAILDAHQKEVVANWCQDFRKSLEAQYPMDSLTKEKK